MPLFTRDTIVNFMTTNIVKCLVDNPANNLISPNGTVKVIPNLTGGTIDGNPGGRVYWLEFVDFGTASPDAIEIYWVPYRGDSVFPPTMLGNSSCFMFTAMMSGCSLGVGSDAGNGVVGVSHANAATSGTGLGGEKGFQQQKKIQHHMLYSEDAARRIITYDNYMMNNGNFDIGMKSTTFGLHRLNHSWKFYTLKYKHLGGVQFAHCGLDYQFRARNI